MNPELPSREAPVLGRSGVRIDVLALVLILATTAVRLWFVASNQLDLVQDEAQYWDWSRTLQLSYYSKGPLIAYLIRLGTMLFGHTELGVRIMAVAGSTAMQIVLYWGLSRLFRRPALGLWALVVANSMPLFLASGVMMTTDNSMLVCWLAALFALYAASGGGGAWESSSSPTWWRDDDAARAAHGRAVAERRARTAPALPFVILGATVAVGALAKYMMLCIIPIAVLYSLVLHKRGMLPRGYWTRLSAALLLGGAAGLAPILAWNIQNDFVGVRHVTHLTGMAGKSAQTFLRLDRFPEYIGGQIGVLLPWWFCFMLAGAFVAVRKSVCPRGEPVLGESLLTERQALLLVFGFWPIWGFIFLWSFHAKILANWPATSYPAGLILAAAAFEAAWRRGAAGARDFAAKTRKVWPVVGLICFAALHLQNWLPLPDQLNPAVRLKGWEDLGAKIESLERERFADPNRVFLFSDGYDMTSALSFYGPGQRRAYCVNTGRRLSQYDFWPGPQDKAGWDAIFVDKGIQTQLDPRIVGLFRRVEAVPYRTTHMGRPAREFTIWLCYGFSGQWPSGDGSGY